uniref:Phytochrome n=1 Tax=Chaetosphaeridium globosum TaxID=96477 RepID=A0A059UK79_CHAGL|nr:phytochrome [Chaetosphaeridium globosum]
MVSSNRIREAGTASSGSSAGRSKVIRAAQTSTNAKLNAEYDKSQDSGSSFCYSKAVDVEGLSGETAGAHMVTAYLQRMQRGGQVQAFGCLVAVEEETLRVIAYSENAAEMLELVSQSVPNMAVQDSSLAIGTDVRNLFSNATALNLERACQASDVSLMNPVRLDCRASGKPFFGILHRIDVGIVIDLEPIHASDQMGLTGSVQSHKLAAKAVANLQSLSGGDVGALCDAVVEELRELTGYARVMAYKFLEDEHGEVVAEIRRTDLDPYIGLHFPATDVPQAARFLFMKNRTRMIVDIDTPQVRIIQDTNLRMSLSLGGSTLRGVHDCHKDYMRNMGSQASLVFAVVVNDTDVPPFDPGTKPKGVEPPKRLWGLVVCHDTRPRYVPFPIRSACEFLVQVFGMQLNMELELSAQLREKHILRTQTLLCDMLLRQSPISIMTHSPNVMDLVQCDGAALYYEKQFWLLGLTPTEPQILELVQWLTNVHKDSTGLSTDSLLEANFPGAEHLGDRVCGMAAARVTSNDFIFWFRSHQAKEIRWGGQAGVAGDVDDEKRMHPRTSFRTFLQVVKHRSKPWEDVEMDAIHSLQLILRGASQEAAAAGAEGLSSQSGGGGALAAAQLSELRLQIQGMDELSTVANEMVRLIETATAPILAVDGQGQINGWNAKVAEITGLSVADAMGRSLARELVMPVSRGTVEQMLGCALRGEEEQNVEIRLRLWPGQPGQTKGPETDVDEVILVVNACASRDVHDKVVGVCFVGQDITTQKVIMDKFTRIQGDYSSIVMNPNTLIPPIFGADLLGVVTEWNVAMVRISGVRREDALGRMLAGEVFGVASARGRRPQCELASPDALVTLRVLLNGALDGIERDRVPFCFTTRSGRSVEVLLTANKRVVSEGAPISGAFFFIHVASAELQQAYAIQRAAERMAESKAKELAYIRQQIKNPLDGLSFARSFLEHTNLTEDQRQLVETAATCENQMRRILGDQDLQAIEEGYLELETAEFTMATVMNAVVAQGMLLSSKRGLQLFCDTPPELKTLRVFGDQLRVQQVLSDFLTNAIQFTPMQGWVEIKAISERLRESGFEVMRLNFHISHSGEGIPEGLIRQMYEVADEQGAKVRSQEGLGLSMCRKIVTQAMNGRVEYVRGGSKCFFDIALSLPLSDRDDAVSVK